MGTDFATYMYTTKNQLKRVNLSPSLTVKAAAVTGMTHLAILGEHTAAGKTFKWLGKKPLAPFLPTSLIPELMLLALELAMYSADGTVLTASKAVLRLRRFGNKSQLIPQLFFFHISYLQCYSNFLASPVCLYCPSVL